MALQSRFIDDRYIMALPVCCCRLQIRHLYCTSVIRRMVWGPKFRIFVTNLVLSVTSVAEIIVRCWLSGVCCRVLTVECRVSLSVVCCLFLVVGCRRLPGVHSLIVKVSVRCHTVFPLSVPSSANMCSSTVMYIWFVRTVYGIYSEERAALHG